MVGLVQAANPNALAVPKCASAPDGFLYGPEYAGQSCRLLRAWLQRPEKTTSIVNGGKWGGKLSLVEKLFSTVDAADPSLDALAARRQQELQEQLLEFGGKAEVRERHLRAIVKLVFWEDQRRSRIMAHS